MPTTFIITEKTLGLPSTIRSVHPSKQEALAALDQIANAYADIVGFWVDGYGKKMITVTVIAAQTVFAEYRVLKIAS